MTNSPEQPEQAQQMSGPVHLEVIAPAVAESCGLTAADDCQGCVVLWLQRRSAAQMGRAPAATDGPIQLSIPIVGLRTDRLRRAIRSRLQRGAVAARVPRNADHLEVGFEPGGCRLHDIADALRGLPVHLDLATASVVDHGLAVEDPPGATLIQRGRDLVHDVATFLRSHLELSLVLIGGGCLLAGFLLHLSDASPWAWGPLLAASAVLCSIGTFMEAVGVLARFRLDVDVLMFVAAIGAASLGLYEEGAFLLFLFGLGSAGEELALHRARSAIDALSDLAPENAEVIAEDGSTQVIPVEDVQVGDHVAVRPFDRLPLDGTIVVGSTAIDQSPVTGESIPVDKKIGDDTFAGTINGEGQIVMQVARTAGESTLAKIMRLVEEAQQAQSGTQRFTERVELWYVPFVMLATALLIVLPPLLGGGSWGVWFYRSMAFLVAASPCALAIGTPAATLCGLARSARMGVLMKGGLYLESLGRIRTIVFDKTGTLTVGRPVVTQVRTFGGLNEDDVLALAAAVESNVNHPLADAIVTRAGSLPQPGVRDVRQIAGLGAQGVVGDDLIQVGRLSDDIDLGSSAGLVEAAVAELADSGCTTVLVRRNDAAIGLIGLTDEPRPEAVATISMLRAMGLSKLAMFTGDHAGAAKAIATRLGIQDVRSSLLPEDKLRLVEELVREKGPVAMVGDGVNDAPALARADIGIAMGAAGTDAAMETADVVLMGSDLRSLVQAIDLSRSSRRLIIQNLIIALSVISIVSPLAAFGIAHLGMAVVLHEGSTVVVVLNSLRLLRWRSREIDMASG